MDAARWQKLVKRGLELSLIERNILLRYNRGGVELNPMDTFSDLQLKPGSEELSGPLRNVCHKAKLSLHWADKKTFYSNIVNNSFRLNTYLTAGSMYT